MNSKTETSNLIRTGIVLLTVITALIHFSLSVFRGSFDVMFTLNGLGYLALLAALYLDLPLVRDNRRMIRWIMIGFTAFTILAWVIMGDKTWWLGWTDKLVELGLIVLLIRKQP
jgi:hypothetical protein